jgi:hypothetical protein
MSNRASRRRDVREFRHHVHRGHIVTHLVDAGSDLSGTPMLARIATAWRAAISQRKPSCFGCEASFANTIATPGAFLFATPSGVADLASVSVLCSTCWHGLPDSAVDDAAVSLLRQISPHGRFLDAR